MGSKLQPSKFDCYANAEPDEPMFVLLARDKDAATIVNKWANRRERRLVRMIILKESYSYDWLVRQIEKIAEARALADAMVEWRCKNRRD